MHNRKRNNANFIIKSIVLILILSIFIGGLAIFSTQKKELKIAQDRVNRLSSSYNELRKQAILNKENFMAEITNIEFLSNNGNPTVYVYFTDGEGGEDVYEWHP